MAGHGTGREGFAAYVTAAREVIATHPLRAPAIMAKVLMGRAIAGLGVDQFFLFDLHNRPVADWRDYLGFYPGFSRALKLINLKSARIEAERDKLAATARLAAAGVPVAPILLVLGRDAAQHRIPPWADAPADIAGAAVRLASPDLPDALFMKPCADFGGHGVMLAERTGERWRVGSEQLTPRQLASRLWRAGGSYGMLVQPQLRSHPDLAAIGGDFGLGCIRVVVALTHDGPRVLSAAVKLLCRPALADNFSEGHSGNLLGNVDVVTGALGAVYGRAPGRAFLMSRFDRHPATGIPLAGVRLPLWPETLAVAEAAARALPESPLLGLDIAITADGPLVIERNLHWDLALPQLAGGEGMRATMRRVLSTLAVDEAVRREAARLLFDAAPATAERPAVRYAIEPTLAEGS